MSTEKVVVGFIGAGGIARSHAYSLNSLRYFYDDAPEIEMRAVCSARAESRSLFAKRFGFRHPCDLAEFITDNDINTVFILGPNKVHYDHLKAATQMPGLKRIYLEKPVCSNLEEEKAIAALVRDNPGINVQIGFQFLFPLQ